jgi:hypothetical protein
VLIPGHVFLIVVYLPSGMALAPHPLADSASRAKRAFNKASSFHPWAQNRLIEFRLRFVVLDADKVWSLFVEFAHKTSNTFGQSHRNYLLIRETPG